MPTMTYPEGNGVTLATTKHQEVFTFLRLAGELDRAHTARPEPDETRSLAYKIKVPTLFVVGDQSIFSSEEMNKRKIEAMPSAEMVVMKGVGHLVAQEKPESVAGHTAEFLGRAMRDWTEKAEKDAKTRRPKVLEERVMKALSRL